ncbi:MAG: ATP-binding protein [Pseudomonadota bacterium]
MGSNYTIPVAGISLACITFVALLLSGFDPVVALAVLAVWIGSLLVAALRPPEAPSTKPTSLKRKRREGTGMRQLIENFSTPMLITEAGTISIANRAARRMLGQHIVGQDPRVAFRQPEAIQMLSDKRDGTALVRGLVRRQDIWQFNRHIVGEDVAVLELINQTAEADISRAHTDFVANASHELRTPLAAILGYVETLSDSSDRLDSPIAQKFLGTINREGQRLQSLISDLMSLSRVEAEKHDVPTEVLELTPLIDRAARDAAGANRLARLDFVLNYDARVTGDRQQLEQVVRNLVDNALKYGAPEGDVRIELAEAREGRARITVSDEGDGISPEHIPHLTRRFYRTDPGRSRASGGTGLGLAIVKHIVERHRGRLDIDSAVGEGTSVSIRLPVIEEPITKAENEAISKGLVSNDLNDRRSAQEMT